MTGYLIFPPARMNILVMGVDGRKGEGFVSRSDSIMLMGVYPTQMRVSLFSIPRDIFINVPNFGSQRINAINMLGEEKGKGKGPELLAEGIATSFDIHSNRYVRLDFTGFVNLIDAVGGITIDVEKTIVDYEYPTDDYGVKTIRFESGVQHMDGEQALIYARTRHTDDDHQRAKRQQQIMSALMAKLINPTTWPAVVRVLNQSLDTNLTILDIAGIAPPILLNIGRFDQLVLTGDYVLGTAKGNAIPNYKLLEIWLKGRFN